MSGNNLPRSDDPWAKEADSIEDNQKDTYYNYLLNEIKSQEDTARQMTTVCAVLIGLYTGLVTNNQSITAIAYLFNNFVVSRLPFSIDITTVLFIPVFFWFATMFNNYLVLRDNIGNKKIFQLEDYTNLIKVKRSGLKLSHILFFISMIILLIFTFEAFYYQLSPNDFWVIKGTSLSKSGDYNGSIQAYDKAIEINPQFAVAWNNKGLALYSQGKDDEAIKAYDETIKLDPNYTIAWYNKGVALIHQGKYDEAIQALNKSIEINPQFVNAWYTKAYVLKFLGRTIDYNATYAKAKELDTQTKIPPILRATAICSKAIYRILPLRGGGKAIIDILMDLRALH